MSATEEVSAKERRSVYFRRLAELISARGAPLNDRTEPSNEIWRPPASGFMGIRISSWMIAWKASGITSRLSLRIWSFPVKEPRS